MGIKSLGPRPGPKYAGSGSPVVTPSAFAAHRKVEPTPGPYFAEFGAVHHEDLDGFIFTVSPPEFADDVAQAFNFARAHKRL